MADENIEVLAGIVERVTYHSVGTSRAVRIFKTYGAEAVQLISANLYRLAQDIRGIGFRTADQVAAKHGIEKHAIIRIRAAVSFAQAEAIGFELAQSQRDAVYLAVASKVLVMAGGPGVGKTTLVKAI